MSSPSIPEPTRPKEASQAAVQAMQAGSLYDIANAPVTGYADLYTQAALGPARMQLQNALSAQGALQAAQAQEDIQSRVDPMAYAARQMNLKATTSRLGQLYGMDPNAFSYRAPSVYATPALPDIRSLAAGSRAIATNVTPVSVGGNVNLGTASGPTSVQVPATAGGASYLGVR
jgi:hypothetical protein